MNNIFNVGEGIAIFGIMLGIGLTKNYWLLLFMFFPIWSWNKSDSERNNEWRQKFNNIELKKLEEEVRILKLKKK